MCVDGGVEIVTDSFSETIIKGETILIPACIENYTIKSDYGKLLEVYV